MKMLPDDATTTPQDPTPDAPGRGGWDGFLQPDTMRTGVAKAIGAAGGGEAGGGVRKAEMEGTVRLEREGMVYKTGMGFMARRLQVDGSGIPATVWFRNVLYRLCHTFELHLTHTLIGRQVRAGRNVCAMLTSSGRARTRASERERDRYSEKARPFSRTRAPIALPSQRLTPSTPHSCSATRSYSLRASTLFSRNPPSFPPRTRCLPGVRPHPLNPKP